MDDRVPPEDPFQADDEAARRREQRRRERRQRRSASSQRTQRSLAERVSGALSAAGDAVGEGRERIEQARRQRVGGEPPTPGPGDPTAPVPPAGPPGSDAELWRRRILALGVVVAGIVVLVLLAGAIGGGDDAETVAEPAELETVSVTIPEGQGRDEIAKVARDAGVKGSYRKASKKPPDGFNLKRYGAADAPSLEGFLFPATYELEKGAPASDLVAKQLEAFEQNLSQVKLKNARQANLTVYDVVTIASMIEREVSVAKERPLVGAVIWNRLRDGEPLGIDATLRYALDKPAGQLLQSELDDPTPFNTRVNAGLPPTPIGNPGLASLEAAADPAEEDFRFYVIKPGTCNEHFFTADAAEFEAAKAEYQAALAAEGGSPTDCE